LKIKRIALIPFYFFLLLPIGFCANLTWPIFFRIGILCFGLCFLQRYLRTSNNPDGNDIQVFKVALAIILIFIFTQFDPISFNFPALNNKPSSYWFFGISSLFIVFSFYFYFSYRCPIGRRFFSPFLINKLDLYFLFSSFFVALFLVFKNSSQLSEFPFAFLVLIKSLGCVCIWAIYTRIDLPFDIELIRMGFKTYTRKNRKFFLVSPLALSIGVFSITSGFGFFKAIEIIKLYGDARQSLTNEDYEQAATSYLALHEKNKNFKFDSIRRWCWLDVFQLNIKMGKNEVIGMDFLEKETIQFYGERFEERGMIQDFRMFSDWAKLGACYLILKDLDKLIQLRDEYKISVGISLDEIPIKHKSDFLFSGDAEFALGNFDGALFSYKEFLKTDRGNAYVNYKIGRIFIEKKQYKEAIDFFVKANQLSGNFNDSHYWIGVCYEKLGKNKEAISEYTQTIGAQPYHLNGLKAAKRFQKNAQENQRIDSLIADLVPSNPKYVKINETLSFLGFDCSKEQVNLDEYFELTLYWILTRKNFTSESYRIGFILDQQDEETGILLRILWGFPLSEEKVQDWVDGQVVKTKYELFIRKDGGIALESGKALSHDVIETLDIASGSFFKLLFYLVSSKTDPFGKVKETSWPQIGIKRIYVR
jgi:tetratricopeptide (TPR) repeat protein